MGVNCTCPCCRHSRAELTDYEYAWYLRGKIEAANSIPKSVLEYCRNPLKATKAERDYEMDLWHDDSGNHIIIREIVAQIRKNNLEVPTSFEDLDGPVSGGERANDREVGWNLKGYIETAAEVPDCIIERCSSETATQEEREFAKNLAETLDRRRRLLAEMVNEMETPDPAFRCPEEYHIPKELYHAENSH